MTGSATSADLPDDGYVLARTSAEYQRLRRQAQLWEQVTAQVLDRVGVGAGMHCLDVGCGPGEVMRLMAERVGASGRVTGLDNDGRVGQEALEVLRATVAGQFEFIQADAEATGEPPGGPFDLVYARLLLFHLRDPLAMLRKMYAWTRPGGVMPLPGWASPTGPTWRGQLRPLAEIGGLFQAVYQSMHPAGLRFGLTTEAAGQAFVAEITEAIRERRGVGMSPLLVSTWKHKP